MSFAIETYPMMLTRPCSFCLCLLGGSVFADFDTDDARVVSLSRISFDGFGCCTVKGSSKNMNPADSHSLLEAVAQGNLVSGQIDDILRRYLRENKDVIWNDALIEHGLL